MHSNSLQVKKVTMWHLRCSNPVETFTSSRRTTVQVWTALAYSRLGASVNRSSLWLWDTRDRTLSSSG